MTPNNIDRPFTIFGNFNNKPGSAPGEIQPSEQKDDQPTTINVYDYTKNHVESTIVESFDETKRFLQEPSKTWIQVQGLGEVEKLHLIWDHFELHPLIREDIVNTVQRPKTELYENCIFIVMRILHYTDEDEIKSEQVSFVLGENYLLSFQ